MIHFDFSNSSYRDVTSTINHSVTIFLLNTNIEYCRLNVFQDLVVKGIVKENAFVMLMQSHSHGVIFGHIEFHLPIGFPLS